MTRVVVISGGFDPIHAGHIEYIMQANFLLAPDILIVGVNSDEWLVRKKGAYFQTFEDRRKIMDSLKCVHKAVGFDDGDGSAIDLIKNVKDALKGIKKYEILFVNGGDRTQENIPEYEAFKDDPQVKFVFGVGGSKQNSSSDILKRWVDVSQKIPKTV